MANGQQFQAKTTFGIPTSVTSAKGTVKAIFANQAIIAVMAASILSPFVVPIISKYVNELPFVKDHPSVASFIPALILFGIAKGMKSVYLSGAVIGIAGTFLLAGLMPAIEPLIAKVK